MKSLKDGMKRLSSKAKFVLSSIWKNCKLELLIIIMGILLMSLLNCIPGVHRMLKNYFDDTRCSGILGYTSVIIGIYVTVWSVFATSASKINEELLKSKVEGQLFFLIGVNLIEAFITTVLCAFVPTKAFFLFPEIVTMLIVLNIVSFAKFIVIVMMITKINIKYIVQEIDKQNAKCTEAQVKLDEVYQRVIK